MGTYILNAGQHPATGKSETLLKMGAEEVGQAPPSFEEIPDGKTLVCVVSNGGWEAAGVATDEHQLWRFKSDPHDRDKRWFLLDSDVVERMLR